MDIRMTSWEFRIENGPTADDLVSTYNRVSSLGRIRAPIDLDIATFYHAPRTGNACLYDKMKIGNFVITNMEYAGNSSFHIKGRCDVDIVNNHPPYVLEERDFEAHYNATIKKGTITFLF